jgi:hypothetical protein
MGLCQRGRSRRRGLAVLVVGDHVDLHRVHCNKLGTAHLTAIAEHRAVAGFLRLKMLFLVGGGIAAFIGLSHIISMYGGMFVFLIYYLRFLGRHTWALTMTLATLVPIAFFFFFEALMRITLPKGWKFTEPLFNWLGNIIY